MDEFLGRLKAMNKMDSDAKEDSGDPLSQVMRQMERKQDRLMRRRKN